VSQIQQIRQVYDNYISKIHGFFVFIDIGLTIPWQAGCSVNCNSRGHDGFIAEWRAMTADINNTV